jgi:hypothetical protein
VAGIEAGKSQREVAGELGINQSTIQRGDAKFQAGKMHQNEPPDEPADDEPPDILTDTARAKLDALETPAARNWSDALRALRIINEQLAVEGLFADRYSGFDWVFGAELETAFAWISALHERFYDEQPERRRA